MTLCFEWEHLTADGTHTLVVSVIIVTGRTNSWEPGGEKASIASSSIGLPLHLATGTRGSASYKPTTLNRVPCSPARAFTLANTVRPVFPVAALAGL